MLLGFPANAVFAKVDCSFLSKSENRPRTHEGAAQSRAFLFFREIMRFNGNKHFGFEARV